MEYKEVYEKYVMLGKDFPVTDKITIKCRTLKEIIEFGWNEYNSIIRLFGLTSSDLKVQLNKQGIDWQTLEDWDVFIMLFFELMQMDTSILFGDLDFSKFKLARDNETGELLFRNEEDDINFDRLTYTLISDFICTSHNIQKIRETAADEATRLALLDEAEANMRRLKDKDNTSSLRGMICAMACTPEFKADYFQTLNYPMPIFMDCVRQVQQIKHFNYVMQGAYAGTVDLKKIPKAELNWLKRAE